MQRDLEIDLLRSFVAVAAHSNFTRAAQVTGRTQSAVSLQIKRLEDIVGCRVFERSRQSVTTTRTGESLLVYAQRILAVNDEALSYIQTPDAVGLVRIGAPDDYATCLLPSILKKFSREHPLIQIEVHCDNSVELLDAQANGALDLVLATHPHDDVAGQLARREPLHWVAAPDYIDDPTAPLSLVLFPQGCACRDIVLASLKQMDRPWHISYSTRSLALIESAVLSGAGVSVMEASVIPAGLVILDGTNGFPLLPGVVISLHQSPGNSAAHISLASDFILSELSRHRI
ncbi:LysR substrate-binding domain-containing protein [Nisaea sp.]|uniref:LysR substrate-binding domain-containing protein n=1 Tax=Nisaea sp. TaxID=2024842 RepID=UPI00326745F4